MNSVTCGRQRRALSRPAAATLAVNAALILAMVFPGMAPERAAGAAGAAAPRGFAVSGAVTAAPQPPGAAVGYLSYEAEEARFSGSLLAPDRTFTHLAAEASGRAAVRLAGQGDYVEFTLTAAANAMNLRYAIPDSADGAGLNATLGLYVDGVRKKSLTLTSKYSWLYGTYPFTNNPADGAAHHFFDDGRYLLSTMPAGSKVRLQVESAAVAPWYLLDVADFERVAPLPAPDGFLDVGAFGADPTGRTDSTGAIQAAIDAGRRDGSGVWLPRGNYRVTGHLGVDRVTLRGAGPWYSVLRGPGVGIYGGPPGAPSQGVHLAGFAIRGEVRNRDDQAILDGIGGGMGGGSTIDNVFVQHTKAGMWFTGPFDGLSITRCRIEDTNADGINLDRGISHATISDTVVRNSGDDGIALWSDHDADHDNTVASNTVVLPMLANAIAIYGGQDNAVVDNLVQDTVTQGAGLHVANRFGSVPLSGTTTLARNLLVRTGSAPSYWSGRNVGAVLIYSADQPITGRIVLSDTEIRDSTYEAIHLEGSSIVNTEVSAVSIRGAGTFAVEVWAPAGSASFAQVAATDLGQGGLCRHEAGFQVLLGGGNSGWPDAGCAAGAA